jgi:Domain of Unknown Function (DUF928)
VVLLIKSQLNINKHKIQKENTKISMKLHNFSLFQQAKQNQMVGIIALGLFLGTMFIGMSEAIAQFKPRTRKTPSIHSRAGGSRRGECISDNDKIPLTLFAPKSYIGETASKSPTLAWYMPTARSVELDLYELQPNETLKKLGKTQELNASAGVNKIAIASLYPELKVGKKYMWQISYLCGTDVPFERAEFQVIDMPSAIKGIISSVRNSTQLVSSLAQQGLWYDAFSEAIKQPESGKVGQLGSGLVKELIQSEEPENNPQESKYIQEQISNLQLIIR